MRESSRWKEMSDERTFEVGRQPTLRTGKEASDVAGLQAHHILPQEFAQDFNEIGFNINDPVFGSWVDATHQSWSYDYNQAWANFLNAFKKEGLIPSKQQILDFAAELAKQFNINWTPPTLSK